MSMKLLLLLSIPLFFDALPISPSFAADTPLRAKIRIATAAPSLSYFPIHVAVQKGFFAKRGFDVEMIQMAAIEGLEYTANQREEAASFIGKWMALTPIQASKAFEAVKDSDTHDGVPAPEQSKAYIATLAATAGLNADLPASTIFDFSLSAVAAKELATKR